MKFAKELERELVPEWRAKYFDYKLGKKKVHAVERALKSVNSTPQIPGRQLPSNLLANAFQSPIRNVASTRNDRAELLTPDPGASRLTSYGSSKPTLEGSARSSGLLQPGQQSPKRPVEEDILEEENGASPLPIPRRASTQGFSQESTAAWQSGEITNYGSFVASPMQRNILMGPPSLELPDPALPPEEESFARHNRAWRQSRFNPNPHTTPPPSTQLQARPDEPDLGGRTHGRAKHDSSHLLPRRNIYSRRRATISSGTTPALRPRLMKRLFSTGVHGSPRGADISLEAYREVDARKAEFFEFLDKELDKIESFYKTKENQASARLQALREQLHEMRDRRLQEIREEQVLKEEAAKHQQRSSSDHAARHQGHRGSESTLGTAAKWMRPLESAIGFGPARIGKASRFMQGNTSPAGLGLQRPETWRDFTRRPTYPDDVPYRQAKRKLKLALQEFYRGLELLKAYALTNRTAFRKINKKYDKNVKARPTQRYMSEKVNKAWFVQSEVLEGLIVAVEDLYARYFERGNHKVAVGKLRSRTARAGDFSGSVFLNGLMLAGGAVFGIQGVVSGAEYLFNSDATVKVHTSYLLQIYAGYFLSLFLFLLFCIDCRIWTRNKINYPFIFEFDPRHNLDWHQLAVLPCSFFFLLGLCIWLNFQQSHADAMFLYWPVLLIGVTVLIIFLPAPILYYESRQWWAVSNFRLVFAGLFPVEFRDFFLGDMYCSQTYSMGNIELFFCLYAKYWNDPDQCNSNHSRFLGFLSTVPGIWRGLQCIRRYHDTRNVFPHLVNCGKYSFTVLYLMTFSLYRIDRTESLKALFITCATVNAIFCSVWDLVMDWSLCNYYAEHVFLRKVLAFKSPWIYYTAMILDPILRFNWIFYAIYSHDIQHSALLAFLVSFSEVCRRGMWTLFRVENEHCTNVGRFRASRDVPLPYDMKPPSSSSSQERSSMQAEPGQQAPLASGEDGTGAAAIPPENQAATGDLPTSAGAEPATTTSASHLETQPSRTSLRRRFTPANTPVARGIARVGTMMTEAHAQDFERRRKPPGGPGNVDAGGGTRTGGASGRGGGTVLIERSPHHGGATVGIDSSDEDEDYEDEYGDAYHDVDAMTVEEQDREDIEAARNAITDAGGTGLAGVEERDMAFATSTMRRRRSDAR